MSDANKFINTYIDLAMATVHENVNTILQMKTKEKLTQELLLEKDSIITDLNARLEATENQINEEYNAEINRLNNELSSLRSNHENHISGSSQETVRLNSRITELENEKNALAERNTNLENENGGLKSKVVHLDTAVRQVGEMKQEVVAKNTEITKLKKQIEELKAPIPKPINTVSPTKRKKPVAMKEEELNDF